MEHVERYINQILFSGIGRSGQQKIMSGRAAVVGCGALGSVVSMTLARAGVGHLRIIDRDFVEFKNLHRQMLFDEKDARDFMPKAIAAQKKLQEINADIHVEGIISDLNDSNIEEMLKDMSIIIDGTDNFETRFLINDFSIKSGIPWIYGGCLGSLGLTFNIIPGEGPCLKCVFETSPPSELVETCDTAGILPSVSSVIGSLQSVEALKILSEKKDQLNQFMIKVDVWKGTWRTIRLEKERKDCDVCDEKQFHFLEGSRMTRTVILCGRGSVQVYGNRSQVMDLLRLKRKLEKVGDVSYNGYLLKFQREDYDMIIFPDGRAIMQGIDDPVRARVIYAKYIGH